MPKNTKNTKNIIIIFIVIILLVLIIYFVIDYNKKQVETTTGTTKPLFGELNQITNPLEKIPAGAISLKISRTGFEPKEFTVTSKKVVNLALTGMDGTHSLVFKDKILEKVKIYVGREETRGISFTAPKSGDYIFYCDIPGHKEAGEGGIMHVK